MGPMGSQMCQPGRMIRPPGQMPMEPDYMSAEAQAKWNRMKSDFYGGAGPPPQMPPSSQFPPYPQPPMMSGRPPFAPAQMRPNAPPVRPGKVRPGGNSRSRARNAQQTAPVPVPQEFQRFPVPNQFQMEPEGLPYPPRGPIRYGPPPPQRQQFVPQQQHFVPPPQPYDMEPSYMPYPVDHMDMNAGVVGGDDAFFDLYSNQMDMGGGPGGGKAGPMGAKFDLVDPSAVQFHHQMSSSPQMQQSVMGPSVVGGGRQQSTVPPPTVNNTYVNATMTIQQMNIQVKVGQQFFYLSQF